MFQAIKPQAEDDHQVESTQGMLDTPVGGRSSCDPANALQSSGFDAVIAFLNDLDHLAGPLDLVPCVRHGSSDLIRIVVAHSFLNRLEVDLETGSGVAEQSHSIEDQRMTLMGGAERNSNSLGFAKFQRFLPGLQGKTELVFGHHILERLWATLVIPDLQEQGVDHDASSKGAVAQRLALEQVVMCLDEGGDLRSLELLTPGSILKNAKVPHTLGRG